MPSLRTGGAASTASVEPPSEDRDSFYKAAKGFITDVGSLPDAFARGVIGIAGSVGQDVFNATVQGPLRAALSKDGGGLAAYKSAFDDADDGPTASRTINEVLLPLASSVRTTVESGGPATLTGAGLLATAGAQLLGKPETARKIAGALTAPTRKLYEEIGYDEGVQRIEDTLDERYLVNQSIVFPIIEDIGNVALVAGSAGVAARVGGKAATSVGARGVGGRLTNVGETASATARTGTASARARAAEVGRTVSPLGETLGQVARPLRTLAEETGMAGSLGELRAAALTKAADSLRKGNPEKIGPGAVVGRKVGDRRSVTQALADYADAGALRARQQVLDINNQRYEAVREAEAMFTPDAAIASVDQAIRHLDDYLPDGEAAALFDAAGVKQRRLKKGPTAGYTDAEKYALITAAQQQGRVLAGTDPTKVGTTLGDRNFTAQQQALARLTLYERLNDMEPGALTNSALAAARLSEGAYKLGEAKSILIERMGADEFDQALRAEMSLDDEARLRVANESLPTNLTPEARAVLADTVAAYRQFSGELSQARIDSGFISEINAERLTPEGEVLPGTAPSRLSTEPVMRAADLQEQKALQIAQEQAAREAERAVKKAGGEAKVEERIAREGITARRKEMYRERDQVIRDVINDVEGADVNAALRAVDEIAAEAERVEALTLTESPGYVKRAEQGVADAMKEIEAARARAEGIAAGDSTIERYKAAVVGVREQVDALRRRGGGTPEEVGIALAELRQVGADVGRAGQTDRLIARVDKALDRLDDADGSFGASRTALDGLVKTIDEFIRRESDDNPMIAARQNLKDARASLRAAQDQHLQTIQRSEKVSNRILNRVAKFEQLYENASRILDEFEAGLPDRVSTTPAGAIDFLTYSNEVFPAISTMLRDVADGDTAILALADWLDDTPTTVKGLTEWEYTDPLTGQVRKTDVTYTPGYLSDAARDDLSLGFEGMRTGGLGQPRPGFAEGKTGTLRDLEENPYIVTRRAIADTVNATMQQKLFDAIRKEHGVDATKVIPELKHGNLDPDGNPLMATTEIARRMTEQGYVRYFDANTPSGHPFAIPRGAEADAVWIKAETASMIRAITEQTESQLSKLMGDMYDPVMRVWKATVLAFVPAWQAGNILGGLAMSMFFGKTNPAQLAGAINTALDINRQSSLGILGNEVRAVKPGIQRTRRAATGKLTKDDYVPGGTTLLDDVQSSALRDLVGTSLTEQNIRRENVGGPRSEIGRSVALSLDEALAGETVVARTASKMRDGARAGLNTFEALAGVSYKANTVVDKLFRSMVYVSKIGEGVDPTTAVRMTLDALGDYSKLTQTERTVLRRVAPFYTWTRHITGALWRHMSDVNEMDRTLLFTHVLNIVGEPNEEESLLPEYASAYIHTGYNEYGVPTFYNPRRTDPFSDAFAPIEAVAGGPGRMADYIARSSGPILGSIYQGSLSRNALTGAEFSGIEGPKGQAPRPSYTELAKRSIPQFDLGRDIFRIQTGRPLARLGDETPFEGDPGSDPTLWYLIGRFMGVPTSRGIDTSRIQEQDARRLSRYAEATAEAERLNSGG